MMRSQNALGTGAISVGVSKVTTMRLRPCGDTKVEGYIVEMPIPPAAPIARYYFLCEEGDC